MERRPVLQRNVLGVTREYRRFGREIVLIAPNLGRDKATQGRISIGKLASSAALQLQEANAEGTCIITVSTPGSAAKQGRIGRCFGMVNK
jgi:hypothetical protein